MTPQVAHKVSEYMEQKYGKQLLLFGGALDVRVSL